MSTKESGGLAFPLISTVYGEHVGMTLRDYFAAKVIGGMASNDAALKRFRNEAAANLLTPDACMATAAYVIADAMLAERAK